MERLTLTKSRAHLLLQLSVFCFKRATVSRSVHTPSVHQACETDLFCDVNSLDLNVFTPLKFNSVQLAGAELEALRLCAALKRDSVVIEREAVVPAFCDEEAVSISPVAISFTAVALRVLKYNVFTHPWGCG